MTTPRIEEMVGNIEKSLEAKFNLVVRALIQNINGTITEGERMDICNKLNQDGINEIRQALAEAHQAGIDEAVERVNNVINPKLPEGMATTGNCVHNSLYGLCGKCAQDKLQAIDDTIKALQDNK